MKENKIKNISLVMGMVILGNQNIIITNANTKTIKDDRSFGENLKNANINYNNESTKNTNNVSWLDEYVALKVGKDIEDIELDDYKSITEIILPDKGITEIPYELSRCTNLTKLDLSGNEIYDFEFLSLSSKLVDVNLSNNFLTEIPYFVKQLTGLTNLDLSDNQIVLNDTEYEDLINNNTGIVVNLDKNLINDNSINPNPKRITYPDSTMTVKLGRRINFDEIYNKVTISGEPLSQGHKRNISFNYRYNPLDGKPFDNDGTTLRLGMVEGTISLNIYSNRENPLLQGTNTYRINIIENTNKVPEIIAKDVTIYEGQKFVPEEHVTVIDDDDDILDRLTILSDVNVNQPGVYTVIYTVIDSDGERVTKTIKVTVKEDLAPIINVEDIIIKKGSNFNVEKYFSTYDEVDGDLTKKTIVDLNDLDTSVEGEYTITLSVEDSKGNTSTKSVKVTVVPDIAPEIQASDISIMSGWDFNPLDYVKAIDEEDGDLTKKVTVINNNVKTDTPGVYTVTFSVTDSANNTTIKTINVTVEKYVGDSPIITASDKEIVLGVTFNPLEGIIALDKEDGNITEKVKVIENTVDTTKLGEYKVVYQVEDSHNNISEKTIKVVVTTGGAPLINASDKTILLNSTFNPLEGVSAIDKEDGDLTSKITVMTNTVDTSKLGIYDVIYKVEDSSGNVTTKTVKITVSNKLPSNNLNSEGVGQSTNKPQTGDNSLFMELGLITASGASLISLNRKNKKDKKRR